MGPTPQMMPGARPGEVHAETVDAVDPELAESIPVRVRELLGQVDDIREQSGEAIDLVAWRARHNCSNKRMRY